MGSGNSREHLNGFFLFCLASFLSFLKMKMNEKPTSLYKLPLSFYYFSLDSTVVIEQSTKIDVRIKGYEL